MSRLQTLCALAVCPLLAHGQAISFDFVTADGDGVRVERAAASSGYTRKITKGGKLYGTFSCPGGTRSASVTMAHDASPAILRCTIDQCSIDFSTAAARPTELEVATWDRLDAIVCLEPIQLSAQTTHTIEMTVLDCDERCGIELEQLRITTQKPTLPRLPVIVEAERPGRSVYRSSASGGCSRPMKVREEIVLPFCTEGGQAEMLVRYSQDGEEVVRLQPGSAWAESPYPLWVYPLERTLTFPVAEVGKPATVAVMITNELSVPREAEILLDSGGTSEAFVPASQIVTVSATGSIQVELAFTAPAEGQFWAEVHILNEWGNFVPILLLAHTGNAPELKASALTARPGAPSTIELQWLAPFSDKPLALEASEKLCGTWHAMPGVSPVLGTSTQFVLPVSSDGAASFFRLRPGQ